MPYIPFWVHQFAEHATKSVKNQFTKLGRMTLTDSNKKAKIILKLLILSRRTVLRRNQGGPSNKENL